MNLRTEQVILTDIPGNVLEYIIPKGIINIGSTCGASFILHNKNTVTPMSSSFTAGSLAVGGK